MKKYKGLKEKLYDVGVYVKEEVRIEEEEKLAQYKKLSKEGKDLPEDIIKKEYRRILDNGEMKTETIFYQKESITDDYVEALIEIKQTRYLQSIARSLRFFVVLALLPILFLFLRIIFGG